MTNILIGNIAKIGRRRAREEKTSIEDYFAGVLASLADDRELAVLNLQAYAQIAIEDHVSGGGPLRAREVSSIGKGARR